MVTLFCLHFARIYCLGANHMQQEAEGKSNEDDWGKLFSS